MYVLGAEARLLRILKLLFPPLCVLFLFHPLLARQTSPQTPPTPKSADYSKEPYVIEQSISHVTFENNGTSKEEGTFRVHILSQAGLQHWGILNFPYASAESSLDIVYVRVVKPGGQVIETPAENVLVMPADVTRAAPFYSDLMIKQVAVKGLEIGDTLEYQFRGQTHSPVDPGQFWMAVNFTTDGIVLQEEIQVRVPQGRDVKVKSPAVQPAITQDGAYRVYTWETSHTDRKDDEKNKRDASDKIPDVQLTTFHSWDEVGQWFHGLIAPRVAVTPDIQAKADELTRDAPTQLQKIQALYSFVSSHYRYIAIDLGIARYQPHPASVVLTNDYGDCKDKHTLFAALLAAIHVPAYPALMKSTGKIDPDMPYPAQFDHVITVLPQGNDYLWLDTTPEVAPFGYLLPPLRDKKALVISDNGTAQLLGTPANLPFAAFLNFTADGTLGDDGTYTGRMQINARGDSEIYLRTILRATPQPQWSTVMQNVAQALGFGGTVDDVSTSPLDKTDAPLHIEYAYTRKDFADWEHRQILSALPALPLAPVPDGSVKDPKPIPMIGDNETTQVGTMKLPKGYEAKVPAPVDLHEKFADYHSTTYVVDGIMHTERHLLIKVREIPVADFPAYRKFRQAVSDDELSYIPLSSSAPAAAAGTPTPIPESEAEALVQKGEQAMGARDLDAAVSDFKAALQKDPNYSYAWFALGNFHFGAGDTKVGLQEMNKAIQLNPGERRFYTFLAARLEAADRFPEAIDVWKLYQKQYPDDSMPPQNLGRLLVALKRYDEAISILEPVVKRSPDSQTEFELGDAYLDDGIKDKALALFTQALDSDSSPNMLNSVAYDLADHNLDLGDALKYAQKAVASLESDSAEITLDALVPKDLILMIQLGATWDTLGWVYFRQGNLDQAEPYLLAGWNLSEDGTIAGHLHQLYEKKGLKEKAEHYHWLDVAASHPPGSHGQFPITAKDLRSPAMQHLLAAQSELSEIRTLNLPNLAKIEATAEFFILYAPGPKAVDVKFIKGSEELKDAKKSLLSAKFNITFPDDAPTRILRRAVLGCETLTSSCDLVLFPPDSVHTLE